MNKNTSNVSKRQKFLSSRSLAHELLIKKSPLGFKEIFLYVKKHLWNEWKESNSHLTEEEIIKKKCGELSKLLSYDTNFVYNALDDTWSLVSRLEKDY